MTYVVDAHALVWFLEPSSRLGTEALRTMRDDTSTLLIPTIVLAELKHLEARRRVPVGIDTVFDFIDRDPRCLPYPLDVAVIKALPLELNIHDAIICATALVHQERLGEEVAVITRDEQIANSGLVKTVW